MGYWRYWNSCYYFFTAARHSRNICNCQKQLRHPGFLCLQEFTRRPIEVFCWRMGKPFSGNFILCLFASRCFWPQICQMNHKFYIKKMKFFYFTLMFRTFIGKTFLHDSALLRTCCWLLIILLPVLYSRFQILTWLKLENCSLKTF